MEFLSDKILKNILDFCGDYGFVTGQVNRK